VVVVVGGGIQTVLLLLLLLLVRGARHVSCFCGVGKCGSEHTDTDTESDTDPGCLHSVGKNASTLIGD
jgi:hypothetical protein